MASAEGQVQEMSYSSTFPLLINLNNRPTYLVSLKDAAGLVKKYAFIDVQDYQKVTVSDVSLGSDKAASSYLNSYKLEDGGETKTETIKIASITSAIIDGNTNYFIVDDQKNRYMVNIAVSSSTLPFLKVGETLDVKYVEGSIRTIKEINSK